MKKRVFIIHGWGGNPKEAWFPWLKKELEARDFEVVVPQMPDAENPRIDTWVKKLQEVVATPDAGTLLIGHSIGCQTIMRYLAQLPEGQKIGKCVFVAGFFSLKWLESDDEWTIAKPWLESSIDDKKVLRVCNSITALFSDTDPFVPLQDKSEFENRLKAKTILLHDRGHFSGSDNTFELPEALTACLE